MPVSTFAEVATRSSPARRGFCPRCDAPRYEDEERCRYCGGPTPVGERLAHLPWDALALALLCAVLVALAAVTVGGGH